MLNAFHWKEQREEVKKTISPQLAYYHRKRALGIHPRDLRKKGLDVVDMRFKANRK